MIDAFFYYYRLDSAFSAIKLKMTNPKSV